MSPSKSHAVILACALALLVHLCPREGRAEEPLDVAKQYFEQGVLLFQDEDYEGALVSFLASLDANPNYKVRYNIGLCHLSLHRYLEAEKHFQIYLSEGAGEIPADRVAEVEGILAEMDGVIADIEIECEVEGAVVFLDGDEVGTTPLDSNLRVNLGIHEIEVRKEGYEDFKLEVTAPGGTVVNVLVDLQSLAAEGETTKPEVEKPEKKKVKKPRKKKPVPPAAFYAMVGIAGALAAGGAVTGGLTLKKNNDFHDTDRDDTDTWTALRDEGKKLALTTDVLLISAGGVALVGVMLAIFTDFKGEEKEASLVPAVGPEMVGMQLSWRF